ncbi:hypothetical protein BG842_23580 [Haladaptatus sp. W1]|uniref:hypothetical protein n=1 Tax=Haladaptatus sp. W1 TaxID=1897478 RepID=UPI000849D585|nr:hypothetical protein [Haladaptatus sp. W1]ODR82274.1 hypothetical protein BG842_23580 [Haladaptatus sp. W1]
MRSQSPALRLVGILACIVGVVGYVAFDWRFESTGSPVVTVLALACVVVAVAATIWRSVGSL